MQASTGSNIDTVTMNDGQKRPHLLSTTNHQSILVKKRKFGLMNKAKTAPPPMTASQRRLEKLLDEDPKAKKKKKILPHQVLVPAKNIRTSTAAAAAAMLPPNTVLSSSRSMQQRPKNVLTFGGGLSSAPTYKKAIMNVQPRNIKNGTSKPLHNNSINSQTKTRPASSSRSLVVVKPPPILPSSVSATRKEDDTASSKETVDRHEPFLAISAAESTTSPITTNTTTTATKCTTTMDSSRRLPVETHQEISSSSAAARTTPNTEEPETEWNPPPTAAPTTYSTSLRGIGLRMGRNKGAQKTSFSGNNNVVPKVVRPREEPASTTTTNVDTEEGIVEDERVGEQGVDKDEWQLPPPPTWSDCTEAAKQQHTTTKTTAKPTIHTPASFPISNKNSEKYRQPRAFSASMNDNFVRLNLRNSAGACRGARSKKMRRKSRYDKDSYYQNQSTNDNGSEDEDNSGAKRFQSKAASTTTTSQSQSYVSRMTGLDPLDDFLDGVFGGDKTNAMDKTKKNGTTVAKKTKTSDQLPADPIPQCARHQRPCKLIVVKKNTKGNRGRKFYACSMPRGEQCDHFQWAEDTLEAARQTIANSCHSSFIARQVKAHVDRFRTWTVPELKEEAERKRLNKNGKKSQLLLRLAVWARDEIAKAVPYPDNEKENDGETNTTALGCQSAKESVIEESESDEDDSLSSPDEDSEDELEFYNDGNHDDVSSELEADIVMEKDSETPDDQTSLLSNLQSLFGHSNFRDGQEWAITRCLEGKKSLLVAPTGFGKSLCYALPAALMDGVCVVVSPLISLIQDQLRSLPPRIPAATLSGSISASATAAILDDVIRKRIKILFVSPERLTSPSFRRLFNTKWNPETQQHERKFPEISLLCVDEAHCVSQWAHNFRPCFLRFKGLLRLMKPKSILAMTATAGPRVVQDISRTLGIIETEGPTENDSMILNDNILLIDKARDNIDVSCQFVANQEERLEMISKILKPKDSGARSKKCKYAGVLAKGAVIVYVWRQLDTEVVTENLIAAGVSGGVVMYHGGMDASARTKAQSKFMRGKARICVATVAFGMGIDKADVEGIIHLNLSSSPEHYLQEIGRAGRDGRQARAIALPTIEEIPIRHSLVHSNFVSKSQILALLHAMKKIVDDFSDCQDGVRSLTLAIPVESMVLECDCKVETIETLLSILEQNGGDNPLLHIEGFNYDKATIAMKKRKLEKLAEKEEIAACIQRVATCCDPPIGAEREDQQEASHQTTASFQRHFLAYSQGSYAFSVAKVANAMGPSAESRHVFAALRRLQSSSELELALDTSSKGRVIMLKLSEEGCSFFGNGNLEEQFQNLTDLLYDSFSSSVLSGADKVLDINHILHSVCTAGQIELGEPSQLTVGKSSSLMKFQEMVGIYFCQGLEKTSEASRRILPKRFFTIRQHELENDLYALIRDLPILVKQAPVSEHAPVLGDNRFPDYTVVATTKFLHGLDSPRAPAATFRGHPLFGKWRDVHFCILQEAIANLVKRPTKE